MRTVATLSPTNPISCSRTPSPVDARIDDQPVSPITCSDGIERTRVHRGDDPPHRPDDTPLDETTMSISLAATLT